MLGVNTAIGTAVVILLQIIQYAILIRVIVSWLPFPKDNQFIRLLYQITDPVLMPIRNMIERTSWGRNMMIDFSPIIAFLILGVLINIIAKSFHVSNMFLWF